MIIEEAEFGQNRAYSQKEWVFCFWHHNFYGHTTRNTDTDLWEEPMPAIASLEDLQAAQKDLLEAKDLDDLKVVFKKWRRIGWKNVCKMWLQESTPEKLKGEGK